MAYPIWRLLAKMRALTCVNAFFDVGDNKPRDALGLGLYGSPLDVVNFARRVDAPCLKGAADSARVPLDKGLGHLDDAVRTAAADRELNVLRPWIIGVELADAFRICRLEAVDRLVVVSDHGQIAVGAEQVEHLLLRSIEVLVLVYEHVVERCALIGLWIVREVAQSHGHHLSHQHRSVPAEGCSKRAS